MDLIAEEWKLQEIKTKKLDVFLNRSPLHSSLFSTPSLFLPDLPLLMLIHIVYFLFPFFSWNSFSSLLSPIDCLHSLHSPWSSKTYFYFHPPCSFPWWKELGAQALTKVAKDIILTHNGETTVRPSAHLIVRMYIFQIRECIWMNPTTVCLKQMLSGEYQCGPFRPEVTNAGSQRPLDPFTSRIKILLAKRFAITQTAPTHSFTAALQQPIYRHVTTHTHTHTNKQTIIIKNLLFDVYGDTEMESMEK